MGQDYFTNTQLAESSRALFNKKLSQYTSFMPEGKQNIDYLINNPEEAAKALNNQTALAQTSANRHMFYSAVVAYLKHTDKGKQQTQQIKSQWDTIQKNNWEERRQQALNNEPTQNQIIVAQTLKWQDVLKARDEQKTGSLEKLLLALYTYIPPVRADYFDVKINKSEDKETKDNQLVLNQNSGTLIIRDFKTKNKYNEIRHQLPQALYDEIQASLKSKPRPYIFVMPTNQTKPYDRGAFSKWANKILTEVFKAPMTLTSLRHLFVSTLDFNKTKARDLEQIGNAMGHSISMQKGYQWLSSEQQQQQQQQQSLDHS
jgi:hypothetical protein